LLSAFEFIGKAQVSVSAVVGQTHRLAILPSGDRIDHPNRIRTHTRTSADS